MKQVIFKNRGVISPIDLTTMGDSCKKEDDLKIGKYDSGLKYAICILVRLGFSVYITTKNKDYEAYSELLTIGDKEKNLLNFRVNTYENGVNFQSTLKTGFAVNMGDHWETWMAFRELYSNCKDEDEEYEVIFNNT